MKTKKTSNIPALLLGALALLLWLGCSFLVQRAGDFSGGALARWPEGEGASPAQLRRAERYAREDGVEDPPVLTLWREKREETVRSGDRSGSANVLEYWGGGDGAWPAGILAGGYPASGDTGGCAVDRALADALWGTGGAVGKTLRWQERTYTVRGVLEGTGGLLLVPAGDGLDEPFPYLFLCFDDPDPGARTQAFLNRNQLAGATVIDLSLVDWALRALSALPAVVLCLGLLWRLLRRGLALSAAPLLLAGYLPPALAGAAASLWCAGFPPNVPNQLIPTRWSDFSFWTDLLGTRLEALGDYLSLAPGLRDQRYWPLVLGGAALSFAAAAVVFLAAERVRIPAGRTLFAGCLFTLGGTFCAAMLFAPAGGVGVGRGVWLLPPLWLLVSWTLELHRDYLKPRGGETCEGDGLGLPPAPRAAEDG